MPEQSIEAIEYSEGIYSYSRFYPGRSTFSTVSCHKGLVKGDQTLAKWIRRTSEGWNYRGNMYINQYRREDVSGLRSYSNASPSRRIYLVNCFPVRFKPGSDFDAMSVDISVQEIEFQVERFVVLEMSGSSMKEVAP